MMKLFKTKEKTSCCGKVKFDEESVTKAKDKQNQGARIKVLGSGCTKCITLEKNTKDALAEMGKSEVIEHVTDFTEIASYGVMSTPALVLDGKVISFGKVLSKDEIINLFSKVGL